MLLQIPNLIPLAMKELSNFVLSNLFVEARWTLSYTLIATFDSVQLSYQQPKNAINLN